MRCCRTIVRKIVITLNGGAKSTRWLFTLLLLVAGLAHAAGPDTPARPHNVLIIDGERHELPGLRAFEAGLRQALAGAPGSVEFFVEHLDNGRFGSAQAQQAYAQYIKTRYAGRPIDVVVAFTESGAEFVLAKKAELFPQAHVVLSAVSSVWQSRHKLHVETVTVPINYDYRGTLELALALDPGVREVAIVHGSSAYDRARLDEALQAIGRFGPQLKFRALGQLPLAAIEDEVRRLPPTSIVLQTSLVQNAEGRPVDGVDFARRLAEISPVPVYGIFESYLRAGALGGSMWDQEKLGRATAAVVRKILAGQTATAMPADTSDLSVKLVSWRGLQRWQIAESRVPQDAQIRFRPPSMWDQYRSQLLIIACGLSVLAVLVVVLLIELARRHRSETALRESEQRFRTIADAAPVMVWIAGEDRMCTFCSRSWLEFTGRTLEQEIGTGWMDSVHPEDRARCRATYERCFDARNPFEMEYRLRRADGEYRWILNKGVPRLSPDGTFLGYIGSCVDFSEHHELQASRRELAHASRVLSMGELAGSLAHELNQPLTVILSNTQAAMRFTAAQSFDLAELRDTLGDVVGATNRASEVIRRMHALVKRGELAVAPLDAGEVVRETAALMRSESIARGVPVSLDIEPDLPQVPADRVQLQQVLLNLLINAFDAMKDCPRDARGAHVRAERDEAKGIRIAVSDRGTGLAETGIENVFKPFYTTKRNGLGLGLSICRSIIEAHGGHITVENNPAAGATFSFTLPFGDATSRSTASARGG